jgi:hypothetical protein
LDSRKIYGKSGILTLLRGRKAGEGDVGARNEAMDETWMRLLPICTLKKVGDIDYVDENGE